MRFDPQRVRDNVRSAATADLLDRVTAYHGSLEPEALVIIMEELQSRGWTPEQVDSHARSLAPPIQDREGLVRMCAFCRKPAVARRWGWHRLFGRIPIFPRPFFVCEEHSDRPVTPDPRTV